MFSGWPRSSALPEAQGSGLGSSVCGSTRSRSQCCLGPFGAKEHHQGVLGAVAALGMVTAGTGVSGFSAAFLYKSQQRRSSKR